MEIEGYYEGRILENPCRHGQGTWRVATPNKIPRNFAYVKGIFAKDCRKVSLQSTLLRLHSSGNISHSDISSHTDFSMLQIQIRFHGRGPFLGKLHQHGGQGCHMGPADFLFGGWGYGGLHFTFRPARCSLLHLPHSKCFLVYTLSGVLTDAHPAHIGEARSIRLVTG